MAFPGPKTRAGAVAFQDHGLVVDGIYGPKTRAASEIALAETSTS
jgi:peptidoglycan hydrolase-like protein with peptidoglycan-binding domain